MGSIDNVPASRFRDDNPTMVLLFRLCPTIAKCFHECAVEHKSTVVLGLASSLHIIIVTSTKMGPHLLGVSSRTQHMFAWAYVRFSSALVGWRLPVDMVSSGCD